MYFRFIATFILSEISTNLHRKVMAIAVSFFRIGDYYPSNNRFNIDLVLSSRFILIVTSLVKK